MHHQILGLNNQAEGEGLEQRLQENQTLAC